MPKDDTQNNNQTPTFMAPDDVLPPMPIITSNSSAAPINDVVKDTDTIMPNITSTTPKKKFAGGKIIATILGLFLLVGGVGAGVFLTSQNQNPNEKASAPATCDANHVGSWSCQEDDKGVKNGFNCECVDLTPTGGYVWSCVTKDLNACPAAGGGAPPAGSGNCPADVATTTANCVSKKSGYASQWEATLVQCKDDFSNKCTDTNIVRRSFDGLCIDSPFCGSQQIDVYYNSTSSCWLHVTNSNCSTTPPNPPAITASCSGVKAYSTNNWTLLTASALSGLRSGHDSVYFCVNGTTSGGSFDKAKFTINGTVQAETTTKRPNSNDFCQLYNLPTGVNSYNVTAQIHHVTLGWK